MCRRPLFRQGILVQIDLCLGAPVNEHWALDFLGDALTYGISLAVIGAALRVRSNAALLKAVSLLVMGLWVFGSTLWRVFYVAVPEAQITQLLEAGGVIAPAPLPLL